MTTVPAPLTGQHHVSILSSATEETHVFYTDLLGMRLAKKSVNQDQPSMYHLFYGDAAGSIGTAVTFFDMPLAARERRGSGSFTLLTLRANGEEAISFWRARLEAAGVEHVDPTLVDGRAHLFFEDPSGTRLVLVDDTGTGPASIAVKGTSVPDEHRIQGLGPATVTVQDLSSMKRFLEAGLGMRPTRAYEGASGPTRVFEFGGGGLNGELHVTEAPDMPARRYGSGGVHHVALTTEDGGAIDAWQTHLEGAGWETTPVIDRYFFRSLYVTGPEGVIIELATPGPGFTIDEGAADLGTALSLPPRLEPRRAEIEAQLRPLNLP